MVLFEDEPRCACKSQLPIAAPQVKMHFCVKCYCVLVENHRVFSLASAYYICELAALKLWGEEKVNHGASGFDVRAERQFFVLLSHKGSSDKGCRSERNLEEHAREVRHLKKGCSCHFHI